MCKYYAKLPIDDKYLVIIAVAYGIVHLAYNIVQNPINTKCLVILKKSVFPPQT